MCNTKIIDKIKVTWNNDYGYVVEYENFLKVKGLEDNDYTYNTIFQNWLYENNVTIL